jgi:hypothetical protein
VKAISELRDRYANLQVHHDQISAVIFAIDLLDIFNEILVKQRTLKVRNNGGKMKAKKATKKTAKKTTAKKATRKSKTTTKRK